MVTDTRYQHTHTHTVTQTYTETHIFSHTHTHTQTDRHRQMEVVMSRGCLPPPEVLGFHGGLRAPHRGQEGKRPRQEHHEGSHQQPQGKQRHCHHSNLLHRTHTHTQHHSVYWKMISTHTYKSKNVGVQIKYLGVFDVLI